MGTSFSETCKAAHTIYNIYAGYEAITFHRITRSFEPAEEISIEKTWNELLTTRKVNRNSELVALHPEQTRREGSFLHVTGYVTDYKHYRTTLEHPSLRVWLTGPSAIARVFYEGKQIYLLGERKSATQDTGGALEFVPGGFLEGAHFTAIDPFMETLHDELEEETGIPRNYITKSTPFWMGQIRNHYQNPRLSQDVCVDYLLDIEGIAPHEIIERFKSSEREHTALHFIPESRLLSFAEANLLRFNIRGRCSLEQLFSKTP